MNAKYVLNTQTGTVVFRNACTDDNPFVFRLIDDETAKAINDRKVDVKDVIEAVLKADHEKEGFSYSQYDAQRKAAIKKLNISEHNMVPVSEQPEPVKVKPDNPEDVITLEKVKAATPKGANKDKGGKSAAEKKPAQTKAKDAEPAPAVVEVASDTEGIFK